MRRSTDLQIIFVGLTNCLLRKLLKCVSRFYCRFQVNTPAFWLDQNQSSETVEEQRLRWKMKSLTSWRGHAPETSLTSRKHLTKVNQMFQILGHRSTLQTRTHASFIFTLFCGAVLPFLKAAVDSKIDQRWWHSNDHAQVCADSSQIRTRTKCSLWLQGVSNAQFSPNLKRKRKWFVNENLRDWPNLLGKVHPSRAQSLTCESFFFRMKTSLRISSRKVTRARLEIRPRLFLKQLRTCSAVDLQSCLETLLQRSTQQRLQPLGTSTTDIPDSLLSILAA